MSEALIGLGTNLGDRRRNLEEAARALASLPGTSVRAVSEAFPTAAVGDPGGPEFLNAAAVLDTSLEPRLLLWHLLLVESRLGRERGRANGPRTIDLDLLFYDDRLIDENDLVVPHPRASERAFVLGPLAAIAPGFRHPADGRTIAELAAAAGAAAPAEAPGRRRIS